MTPLPLEVSDSQQRRVFAHPRTEISEQTSKPGSTVGKRDSIHNDLLEAISETANVFELRQKLLYTTPSRWLCCMKSLFPTITRSHSSVIYRKHIVYVIRRDKLYYNTFVYYGPVGDGAGHHGLAREGAQDPRRRRQQHGHPQLIFIYIYTKLSEQTCIYLFLIRCCTY